MKKWKKLRARREPTRAELRGKKRAQESKAKNSVVAAAAIAVVV